LKKARTTSDVRSQIALEIDQIKDRVNEYLTGEKLSSIRSHILRIERSDQTPHWWQEIEIQGRPDKSDSKSLGTMIEKLIKCEISRLTGIQVTGSSAGGVDIPEIGLDLKGTSERQPQSSHPFTSSYRRILGTDYDILVSIYNGESFLSDKTASLQILHASYLKKTEVADSRLCKDAKALRSMYNLSHFGKPEAKRVLRAVVYSNKMSSQFRKLENALHKSESWQVVEPLLASVDDENSDKYSDADNLCTEAEWDEYIDSPLDGRISISFALQWRFQFSALVSRNQHLQTKIPTD